MQNPFESELQLAEDIRLRPTRDDDEKFLEWLYRQNREDLRMIPADQEFVDNLIAMQYQAQRMTYGGNYPNAHHLIIEWQTENVGRAILNFGTDGLRLVDIHLMPSARGQGCGTVVLKSLQDAATRNRIPLKLSVYRDNPNARRFYLKSGFEPEHADEITEQMVWHPPHEDPEN